MAVDTRDKRSSAFSVGPWVHIGPTPDGTITSVADRQHMAFTYSGIATTQIVPTIPGAEFRLSAERLHYRLTEKPEYRVTEE